MILFCWVPTRSAGRFIYDDVSFFIYVRCIIQLNLYLVKLWKIQAFLALLIYYKTEEQMSNSRYSQKKLL